MTVSWRTAWFAIAIAMLAGTTAAQQMPEPAAASTEDVAAPMPGAVSRASVRRPDGKTYTFEIPSPKRGRPAPVTISSLEVTRWGAFDPGLDRMVDPQSPGLSTVFAASTFDDNQTVAGNLSIPPDSDGAVGPAHVVSVMNILIEWFDKAGNRQFRQSLRNFFTPAVLPAGYLAPTTGMFDPKVLFDPWANRFIVVAMDGAQSGTSSRIYLAVSDDADPNGIWYYHFIPANVVIGANNSWADFPGFGFDSDFVYVTSNMFAVTGNSFQGVRLWIMPKSNWYSGATPPTPAPIDPFTGTPGGPVATTAMPALVYPPATGPGTRLLSYSGLSDGTNEFLQVVSVANPGTTPSFNAELIDLGNIDNTTLALPGAPQRGSGVLIASNDRRLSNHVVQFGSRIVAAAATLPTTGPDSGQTTATWWDVDVSAAAVVAQTGTIGGEDIAAGAHTYFPSIFRNAGGDIVVGFSISAPRLHASSGYATRAAGDPAGQMRPAALLAKGTDYYLRRFGGLANRWGDYSGTALDPGDGAFWVYNQHAIGRGTITATLQDGRFGTSWGRVAATAAVPALYLGTASATEAASNNTSFNGLFEPGERLDLLVPLRNTGTAAATSISVTLSTTTPGVSLLGSAVRSFASIGAGTTGAPSTPWQVQLDPGMPYGTLIEFVATVSSNAGTQAFDLDFGVGPATTTARPAIVVNETLDATVPAANPAYTAATGVTDAAGARLNRDGVASTCAAPKTTLGQSGGVGQRRYDAYTFANPSNVPVCVSITHASTCAVVTQDQFSAVYFPGFDPANQVTNWRADRGVIANSASGTTFSVLVPARQAFTVVVSEVNSNGAATCGTYTLTVNGAVTASVAPAPSVSSPTATAISIGAATLGGTVDSDNGSAVLERGVVYSVNTANGFPTRSAVGVVDVPAAGTTGAFTVPATGLAAGTVYAYRAYARSANGTTYTSPATFSTLSGATTTAITGDSPDPSVVGQSYTVVVRVTGSTQPTGTVTVTDGVGAGSVGCGPIALVGDTATTSTASCPLASTTAGIRTLTATYSPTGVFTGSAGNDPHEVTPATTTLSVSGPPRARVGTAVTYTATLGVTAPGAGNPAGTVTITSGALSCQFAVPTASPVCALTFPSVGPRTVSASFVPTNGNFSASASSGAGNAGTLVFSQSDVAVSKTNGINGYSPGQSLVYTIVFSNLGPDAAANIRLRDNVPAGLGGVSWTCSGAGGAACPAANGSNAIDLVVPVLPASGTLTFSFGGTVIGTPAQISNTALVELPADTTVEDPVPGNNSATDTDRPDALFANGFEQASINAPAGQVDLGRVLSTVEIDETARVIVVLDDALGRAVEVYARRLAGRVELMLMQRGDDSWSIGAWVSAEDGVALQWIAEHTETGHRLSTATFGR
jgi:uncharacterized repeat protein (TIGR01451 family)